MNLCKKKPGYNINMSYIEDGDIELMIGGILPPSKDSINFASASPTPDIFPISEFNKA